MDYKGEDKFVVSSVIYNKQNPCGKHIENFSGYFIFYFSASLGRVVGPEVGPGQKW